jgi:phage-related protein
MKGIEFLGTSLKMVREIYVASFEEKVYVLHAFQKKTQKTSKQDLDAAKRALKKVLERQ